LLDSAAHLWRSDWHFREAEVYDLYMKIDQPNRRLMVKHRAPLPDGYPADEWHFHSTQTARSRVTLAVERNRYCEFVLPPPVKLRLRDRSVR
jgi:hypothetical protein